MRSLNAAALALACLAPLGLSACDNPKQRDAPASTAPGTAAPAETGQILPAMSEGLAKLPEFPGFYLDRIGPAADPMNKQPAIVPAGVPLALDGFGFDQVAGAPARGVDVVVNGKAYGTVYGSPRADVASFYKNLALGQVGYTALLPAGTIPAGDHKAVVRVVAADGKGYFESPAMPFTVQ